MRRSIAILGSTGSIGRNTLDVIARHPGQFEVVGLAAGRRIDVLAEQIRMFRPRAVAVADSASARGLRGLLGGEAPDILSGTEGAATVAVGTGAHTVVAAIVGAAGLIPTLAAVTAGMVVALANKEALVVAGELMVQGARESGAQLIPVDSEHNAIHQCLRAGDPREVKRLILTASGGPFRGRSARSLEQVTPAEALNHPVWSMGPKITIDSATLMNKGLEVIEAHWLFGVPAEAIDVVLHPQGIVHSMVEFCDGSLIAQMGTADMRQPIQYALTWPERWDGVVDRLNLTEGKSLSFEPPDRDVFRCLDLAYRALEAGGDTPARLNAANEIAVDAFLNGRIGFPAIPRVIQGTMEADPARPVTELAEILDADQRARQHAARCVEQEHSRP